MRRIVEEPASGGSTPAEQRRLVTLGGDTRPVLPAGTITSAPFVVPPAAILRLAIGIEEPAWTGDSAPLLLRVVYEDQRGRTQDLFRRILDPAHKPADRRWYDNDVDLSDLAGSELRLRFVTEPVQRGDTRTSLPVWADPRVLAAHGGAKRPSIVLVSLGDDVRPHPMSAGMAALAARGTLFENADRGTNEARHDQIALLADQLRRAGFATTAIIDQPTAVGPSGFSSHDATGAVGNGNGGDAARAFGRAVAWAGRHVDEPFFLFVQTSRAAAARDGDAQPVRQDDLLGRLVAGLHRLVPDDQLLLVIEDTAGATGPLLFLWPGHVTAGRRLAEPAASRDVAPTILQLVGVPVPPEMRGRSLDPLLAANTATPPRDARSAAAPTTRDATGRASATPGDVR